MADLSIRALPEDVYAALKEKAASEGKALEAWLRERLTLLAAQPTIKQRYAFKCYGPDGTQVTIQRHGDGEPGGGAKDLSQEQFAAYKKARLLVQRNALGDREEAHDLLSKQFEMVFEVPL